MLRRIVLLALSALVFVSWGGWPAVGPADRTAHRLRRRQRRLRAGRAADRAQRRRPRRRSAAQHRFEIVEGADLSQADLIRTYREFLAKVTAGGPDTLAFVYFAGHALSFDGENFLLGVDARLARDSDIALESVRLSDLLRPLGNSPARAKVMMIDAARPLPFQPQGRALARGLEAIDAAAGHAGRVLVRARYGRARSAGRLRRLCHRDCRNAARARHRSRYGVHPHPQPHPFDVGGTADAVARFSARRGDRARAAGSRDRQHAAAASDPPGSADARYRSR